MFLQVKMKEKPFDTSHEPVVIEESQTTLLEVRTLSNQEFIYEDNSHSYVNYCQHYRCR